MLVTTTPTVQGHEITKYLGVVCGEVVIGAHLGKDILASFTNIVGGRSNAYESTLRETRDPLPEDHLAIVTERALSARTGEVLGAWRKGRDAWITHVFGAIFGPLPGIPSPAQADHPDAASHKE